MSWTVRICWNGYSSRFVPYKKGNTHTQDIELFLLTKVNKFCLGAHLNLRKNLHIDSIKMYERADSFHGQSNKYYVYQPRHRVINRIPRLIIIIALFIITIMKHQWRWSMAFKISNSQPVPQALYERTNQIYNSTLPSWLKLNAAKSSSVIFNRDPLNQSGYNNKLSKPNL